MTSQTGRARTAGFLHLGQSRRRAAAVNMPGSRTCRPGLTAASTGTPSKAEEPRHQPKDQQPVYTDTLTSSCLAQLSRCPTEPCPAGTHAAEPKCRRDERQRHHPEGFAPDPVAAEPEEHEPDSDEDSHCPAGRHQPGCEEEGREGKHCGEAQHPGHVPGYRTSVAWHGRIVPRAVVDLDARQTSEPNAAGLCLGTRLRTPRGCRKTVS